MCALVILLGDATSVSRSEKLWQGSSCLHVQSRAWPACCTVYTCMMRPRACAEMRNLPVAALACLGSRSMLMQKGRKGVQGTSALVRFTQRHMKQLIANAHCTGPRLGCMHHEFMIHGIKAHVYGIRPTHAQRCVNGCQGEATARLTRPHPAPAKRWHLLRDAVTRDQKKASTFLRSHSTPHTTCRYTRHAGRGVGAQSDAFACPCVRERVSLPGQQKGHVWATWHHMQWGRL